MELSSAGRTSAFRVPLIEAISEIAGIIVAELAQGLHTVAAETREEAAAFHSPASSGGVKATTLAVTAGAKRDRYAGTGRPYAAGIIAGARRTDTTVVTPLLEDDIRVSPSLVQGTTR